MGYASPVDSFDDFVARLPTAMLVVTVRAPASGEPLGCLVGFATQTSIDPPRFAVCLSRVNRTYREGRDAAVLAVHVVPDDRTDLAELFGGHTGDEEDKFSRVGWHEGPEGVPVLDVCDSRLVGRVLWRRDAGDHDVFVLEPIAVHVEPDERALGLDRAKDIDPGHPA